MIIDNFYKDFKIRDYMGDELENVCMHSGELVDCSLGTNPFLDESFFNKYVESVKSDYNKYPFDCYTSLKNALLDFWNKNLCQDFSEEEIGLGSGSMGVIRNLCTFLLDEGDYVLGVAPQFPRFVSEVELRKARYEYYCLDTKNNFKFDVAEFISKISAKYKVIHLENPNNPTGQIIDIKDIEAVVKVAKESGSIVVVDEAYGDYMDLKNSSISLVKKYDNLVVFRSGSKFWGLPNHRVGYVFANKEIIKVYNAISLPFSFSDYSCRIFENVLKDYELVLRH